MSPRTTTRVGGSGSRDGPAGTRPVDMLQGQEEPAGLRHYDWNLVRRLAPFARNQRVLLLLALGLSPLTAAAVAIRPGLTERIIDAAIVVRSSDLVLAGVLQYLVAISVHFLSQTAHMYLIQLAGQRMMADLRARAFAHATRLHLGYFDRTPIGRVLTRITNDIETLGESFASGAVTVITDVLTMLGIVAMMFYVDWRWTLVTLMVVPPLGLVVQMVRRHARDAFRTIRARVAQLNAFLSEQVQGIAVIQAFGRERACAREYDKINVAYKEANYRAIRLDAMLHSVVEGVSAGCLAAILWYAAVRAGSVANPVEYIGTVVAFYQFIHLFFVPLRDLSTKYTMIQSSLASAERVIGFLDVDETEAGAAGVPGRPAEREEPALCFRNVTFAYRAGVPVLRDVSFMLRHGEKVAIVGATGAGKSTLVALALRLHQGWRGRITVQGLDAARADPTDLRSRFSVVPQDVFLFAGSVLHNVALGDPEPDAGAVKHALERVGALDLIAGREGGLHARVEARGANFSAGERQLIAFARALYRPGSLLVLDEATANVDTETEARLQEATATLLRGRTAIIIAHRLSTIRQVDRVLVFHHGRIVEQGSHAELLRKGGVYSRLHRLHFEAPA